MRFPPLNSLRVFYLVGKYLSFNKAAQKLNVTNGAISKQIKRLEEHLGATLFIRDQQNLCLTPKGSAFHQQLEASFQIIDQAISDFDHSNLDTKLNILCAPTYANKWLIPQLNSFQNRSKKLNITIHSHAENEFIYDAEIRFGNRERARFSSQLLAKESFIAVCAPSLLEEASQLENQADYFLHIAYQGGRLPIWETWLKDSQILVDAKSIKQKGIELYTLDQVITAAKAGLGFAIVDIKMISEEITQGSLIQFHHHSAESEYGYWLDVHPEKVGLSKLIELTKWLELIHQ